uniref:Uncharacterized protein n=1 Tax=Cupriavidus taiwanensis TaxID=164546 RepID=A0A375HAN2_9BURK|nr:protein of unknown function [Cupriavidus taiwanensis]
MQIDSPNNLWGLLPLSPALACIET